jgi:4-hydroxymandelate oxidase
MRLIDELEARARAILPAPVFDLFAGGAGEEQTLRQNREAWQRVWLVPRQLAASGGQPDPSTILLGRRLALPVILAPVAAQCLLHPGGEPAAARAAAAAGTVFCLSTRATADLAEVAAAAPQGARWFQLYMGHDRERVREVLSRLRGCGYDHVVLTVDLPVAGRRERELRHGAVRLPAGVAITDHLGGAAADGPAKPPPGGWAPLSWADVGWAAAASGLPVVVKGILSACDAQRALDAGAAGVVVSNHGARQLDGSVPTAVALRDVSRAVAGRVPVLVDGGIRSGADVVRAVALGAAAVMIGRPYAWGLAAGGEDGVGQALRALREDVVTTLALLGAASPVDVDPQHVRLQGWD